MFPLTSWSADACKSYELTWAIREASERSRKKKMDASQAAAAEQKVEALATDQKIEAPAIDQTVEHPAIEFSKATPA